MKTLIFRGIFLSLFLLLCSTFVAFYWLNMGHNLYGISIDKAFKISFYMYLCFFTLLSPIFILFKGGVYIFHGKYKIPFTTLFFLIICFDIKSFLNKIPNLSGWPFYSLSFILLLTGLSLMVVGTIVDKTTIKINSQWVTILSLLSILTHAGFIILNENLWFYRNLSLLMIGKQEFWNL